MLVLEVHDFYGKKKIDLMSSDVSKQLVVRRLHESFLTPLVLVFLHLVILLFNTQQLVGEGKRLLAFSHNEAPGQSLTCLV